VGSRPRSGRRRIDHDNDPDGDSHDPDHVDDDNDPCDNNVDEHDHDNDPDGEVR
jgi:hypothetical protein